MAGCSTSWASPAARPRGRAFQLALDEALQHMQEFLRL